MKKIKDISPFFSRGEIANILRVTTATIANREKKGIYPLPTRDLNNRRIYTIDDVLRLQSISFKSIDPKPIISVLHDKGFDDIVATQHIIDEAIKKITK